MVAQNKMPQFVPEAAKAAATAQLAAMTSGGGIGDFFSGMAGAGLDMTKGVVQTGVSEIKKFGSFSLDNPLAWGPLAPLKIGFDVVVPGVRSLPSTIAHFCDGVSVANCAGRVVATAALAVVGAKGAGAAKLSLASKAARDVPARVARVVEDRVGRRAETLGAPGEPDVFVTNANDIAGMSATQISERLSLYDNAGRLRSGPYSVFEFDTPIGIASPIRRSNPGFVGGGRTAGGASEYVVPNSRIDLLGNLQRRTVR